MPTLHVHAGRRTNGSPVEEELLVESLGQARYRLLCSPGLVLGLAAGDVFELGDDRKPHVTERGGNVCVQLFCEKPDDLEGYASSVLAKLGGGLDGKSSALLVYTVPVSAGFPALERALSDIVSTTGGGKWFYGNVYEEDGMTPLGWWSA